MWSGRREVGKGLGHVRENTTRDAVRKRAQWAMMMLRAQVLSESVCAMKARRNQIRQSRSSIVARWHGERCLCPYQVTSATHSCLVRQETTQVVRHFGALLTLTKPSSSCSRWRRPRRSRRHRCKASNSLTRLWRRPGPRDLKVKFRSCQRTISFAFVVQEKLAWRRRCRTRRRETTK